MSEYTHPRSHPNNAEARIRMQMDKDRGRVIGDIDPCDSQDKRHWCALDDAWQIAWLWEELSQLNAANNLFGVQK